MFWMKKQGKLIQLNDKPITIIIENNIPFIGVYNTQPIFLTTCTVINGKWIYKILTTSEYKNKIKK